MPTQTAQARINGLNIQYAVSGAATAPPVLLHHPLAPNLAVWDEFAEVPGTSDMPQVEDPARFAAEVLPFFAKHEPMS